jgi:hypothetical protein
MMIPVMRMELHSTPVLNRSREFSGVSFGDALYLRDARRVHHSAAGMATVSVGSRRRPRAYHARTHARTHGPTGRGSRACAIPCIAAPGRGACVCARDIASA